MGPRVLNVHRVHLATMLLQVHILAVDVHQGNFQHWVQLHVLFVQLVQHQDILVLRVLLLLVHPGICQDLLVASLVLQAPINHR